MKIEKFRWVAAVIAAHHERKITGRTRLQKTIMILQRCGLPTDYDYSMYHYGPYSEGLQADLGLLSTFGLITETQVESMEGNTYYVFEALEEAKLNEIKDFQSHIDKIQKCNTQVLELAATYDAYREMKQSHSAAIDLVKRKKTEIFTGESMKEAFQLLLSLGLPAN